MKSIWKYLLTIIISVLLSWMVITGVLEDALKEEHAINHYQLSVYFADLQRQADLKYYSLQEDVKSLENHVLYLESTLNSNLYELHVEIQCIVEYLEGTLVDEYISLSSCVHE